MSCAPENSSTLHTGGTGDQEIFCGGGVCRHAITLNLPSRTRQVPAGGGLWQKRDHDFAELWGQIDVRTSMAA